MRLSFLVKCPSLLLASTVLLVAAHSAGAETHASRALPDRGAAGLTFFSLAPDSAAGAVPSIRSTRFSDPLQAHRERFFAPEPPVPVKNPFLPAAQ
jgi:hypothetical protein